MPSTPPTADDVPANAFVLPTRASVAEEITARLEHLIDEHYPPGQKLPTERKLAQLFSVSRTTVREALAELEQRRRVERHQGRGTIVLDVPESALRLHNELTSVVAQEARDVAELRRVIEPRIASLAAARASKSDLVLMREILTASHDRVTASESLHLDLQFHRRVAQASRNPLLLSVCDSAADLGVTVRTRSHATAAGRRSSAQWHRRIYDSIAAGDSDRASETMVGHLDDVAHLVAQQVSNTPTGNTP